MSDVNNMIKNQVMIKKHLDDNTPFIFAKFGDGELLCMNGSIGSNCDGHPYTPKLANKLRESLFKLSSHPNIYIADWGTDKFIKIRNKFINHNNNNIKYIEYEVLLSISINISRELFELYKSILSCDSRKQVIFIIPEQLNNIKNYIAPNATIINIPIRNAFQAYDNLVERVNNVLIDDDAIIITSCGLLAKALISDLYSEHNNITCMDFGSAFDPLLIGHTRDGQASYEVVKKFFNDIKDGKEFNET